jgi:putative nucleotidyltransferase with HDIG domain
VIESFEHSGIAGRIRADWFWEHSIATGLLASKIARIRGMGTDQSDAMFVAGLLHDVGRVIFAERLGDEYLGVIDAADRLGLPLETVESRLLLVNHADLTDKLLRMWKFSPELVNPIALHHLSVGNIRRTAPRMADSVATLGLANRLAHALVLGSSGNDSIYPIEDFLDFLRLTPENVDALCASIPEETSDTKIQMLSHGGAASSSMLDEARAKIHPGIRALHVAVSPARGSTSILLDRLVPHSGSDRPNIAVVRVAHVRERAQLITALRAAEQAAGVNDLPTLVLTAGEGCRFAPGMLGERRVEQATLPLRIDRLLGMLNGLLRQQHA